MALAAALTLGAGTASASFLQLSGGTWTDTSASVPGNVTAGNDVIAPPVSFWDGAALTATTPISLTFYFVGAESGYSNTLNVTGGGMHTETTDVFPGNWPGTPLPFSTIVLNTGDPVPLFFTSSGFSGNILPGTAGGFPSIGFAILECTTGAACFAGQTVKSGEIVAFLFDDGGAGPDDNHDDYVGYMVATPVPLPAGVWLLASGLGALGVALRNRRGRA